MTIGPFGKLPRRIKRLFGKRMGSVPLAASPNDVHPEAARVALEMHAQARCKTTYLGDNICLCRVLGEALMYLDTRDYGISPHLMTDGYWESWVTVAMMKALKPGMVTADVGANFGYYTLLMGLAVRPGGTVYAFEPNPHLVKWLKRSVAVSGTRQITTIDDRAAYKETARKVRLFVPAGMSMNGVILDEGQPFPCRDGDIVEVKTVRLDDVLPAKVDFIKIDAEGAEREIWRGMHRVIDGNPDLQIFLEFNAARSYDPREFLARIEKDGFKLAYIDRNGSKRSADAAEILMHNDDVTLYLTRRTNMASGDLPSSGRL